MNSNQALHIGMLNSYNMIMDTATIEDIVKSGLSIFAHVPDDEIELEDLELMLEYFETHEMYEYCANIVNYIHNNFNPDGTYIEESCECELPTITSYTKKIKCGECNKRIRK
jgi:hypothetical protein